MAKGWKLNEAKRLERFLQNIKINLYGCWEWQGFKNPGGYGRYKWKQRNTLVHRLMWKLFLGDFDEDLKVCHHCDNRSCVRLSHLFLGTQVDNIEDCVLKGRNRSGVGESNGMSKLNNASVRYIREAYKNGGTTQTELGKRFGVAHSAIGSILRNKTWKHVK